MSYNNRGGSRNSGGPPNYSGGRGSGPNNSSSSSSSQQRGFSMNAVPPPSSLMHNRPQPFQRGRNVFSAATAAAQAAAAAVSAGRLPPSAVSKHGYSTMESISQFANSSQYALGKRKTKTEDEYFDDDDDSPAAGDGSGAGGSAADLAYIPAPGSPTHATGQPDDASDDEEDPLDAFMSGLEQHLEKEKKNKAPAVSVASAAAASAAAASAASQSSKPQPSKGVRGDIDDEDDEESYYRYMEENPNAGLALDDIDDAENEIEYDADGNPIAPARRRDIDPLPAIDHADITYAPFERNFYVPHADIAALGHAQVDELRHKLGVRVTGAAAPKPVTSFGHFGFDEPLMKAIRRSEYTQPTAIQSQAVPAALGGRDLIGIAKTGSGKTAAFVWPLLVHVMDQRELRAGEGPIAVILAPTRELSLQIYAEAKKFGKVYNVNVVCCYGGGSKWEQSKALEQGAEVVVATPGRMIDMVKIKATNLQRVTFLVLDEADKMFNMGFEPQVRSICNHVRPDRQTLLFSATFKKRIEKLARDVLTDPVKIVQGDLGEANEDITQTMLVFAAPAQKQTWLLAHLVEFLSHGTVLVFVTKKADAELVASTLQVREFDAVLLHGDMDQSDRNRVITRFKRREVEILVATDVAARGLDIPHIRTVINYDVARDIDTHTHRIGRTGRAGEKGAAWTLVLEKDKEFAGHLVRNLEGANQEVPAELMELAMQSAWFKKSRFQGGKGKAVVAGGAGLGYKERPGLGGVTVSGEGGQSKQSGTSSSSGGGGGSSGSGPATNRLSAMRDTFKNQYNSQFRPSTDRMWEENLETASTHQRPPPPPVAYAPAAPANPNNPFARQSVMTFALGGHPPPQSLPSSPPSSDAISEEDAKRAAKRSRWN